MLWSLYCVALSRLLHNFQTNRLRCPSFYPSTMKLAIAALVTAAASAKKSVELPTEITANSDLGRSLMSQARRLDGQEENDMTWVANYS